MSKASWMVRGTKHMYVDGVRALVEEDRVVRSRINAKLAFVVGSHRD